MNFINTVVSDLGHYSPDCMVKMMKVEMSTQVASLTPMPRFGAGMGVLLIVSLATLVTMSITVVAMLTPPGQAPVTIERSVRHLYL